MMIWNFLLILSSRLDYANSVLYGIPAKYISRLQRTQNTFARVVAGNRTPGSHFATLSKLHRLPVHDRIKYKIATMIHKTIHTGNHHIWLIWFSGTLNAELYGLLLPTFYLLLVVTFHLALEVFARQLLLSGIVSTLTSVPTKLTTFRGRLKSHFFHSALPTA